MDHRQRRSRLPYPIDELDVTPFKIDESFTDDALLEVSR